MDTQNYNGWTNYATWCFNLWASNDEHGQAYWLSEARDALEQADGNKDDAIQDLSDRIKDYLDEHDPLSEGGSMWSDLLTYAYGQIDEYEIAEAWIADLNE